MKNDVKSVLGIGVVICLLLITITPSAAYTTMDLTPVEQDVPLGSDTIYLLEINSDDPSLKTIRWFSEDPNLKIKMQDKDGIWVGYKKVGSVDIKHLGGGSEYYNVYVTAESPLETGKVVDFHVQVVGVGLGWAEAAVTGTSNITPELSTMVLMSAGLLGMIGLVRRQRKD